MLRFVELYCIKYYFPNTREEEKKETPHSTHTTHVLPMPTNKNTQHTGIVVWNSMKRVHKNLMHL